MRQRWAQEEVTRWALIVVMILASFSAGVSYDRCKLAGGSEGRCILRMLR